MKRTGFIKRGKRIKSRRSTPRRSSAVVDKAYRKLVAALPCRAIGIPSHVCSGDVIAHHAGVHAAGAKCTDYDTIPICNGGHGDLHDRLGLTGTFEHFTKTALRVWENQQIAWTRRTLDAHIPPIHRTSPQVGPDGLASTSAHPPPP